MKEITYRDEFFSKYFTKDSFSKYLEKQMLECNAFTTPTGLNGFVKRIENLVNKSKENGYPFWIDMSDGFTLINFVWPDDCDPIEIEDIKEMKSITKGVAKFQCITHDDEEKCIVYSFTVYDTKNLEWHKGRC